MKGRNAIQAARTIRPCRQSLRVPRIIGSRAILPTIPSTKPACVPDRHYSTVVEDSVGVSLAEVEAVIQKRLPVETRELAYQYLQAETKDDAITNRFLEAASSLSLPDNLILQLFERLQPPNEGSDKPATEAPIFLERVSQAIISQPPSNLSSINKVLQLAFSSQSLGSSQTINTVLRLVLYLSRHGYHELGLESLKQLTTGVRLPPGTLPYAAKFDSDPGTMLSIICIRCCSQYQLWDTAFQAVESLMDNVPTDLSSALSNCIGDLLREYLRASAKANLENVAALICKAADKGLPPLDPKTHEAFYKVVARDSDTNMTLASRLFLHLNEKNRIAILSQPESSTQLPLHPPPVQYCALLMRYYAKTSNQRAARLLASEISQHFQHIRPSDLPHLFTHLASLGLSAEIRYLYEFCESSEDPLRRNVLSHAGVVQRLATFYTHRAAVSRRKSDETRHKKRKKASSKDAEDYEEFAKRVTSKLAAASLPMFAVENVHEVTALYKTLLTIGHYDAAIAAIRARLKRAEPPDIIDVSILLGFIAKFDVQLAAQTLKRGIESGLKPDTALYTTMMQSCLQKGQKELAEEMLQSALSTGAELHHKAVSGVLWHSLKSLPTLPHAEQQSTLESIHFLLTRQKALPSGRIIAREAYNLARDVDSELAKKIWFEFLGVKETKGGEPISEAEKVVLWPERKALKERAAQEWIKRRKEGYYEDRARPDSVENRKWFLGTQEDSPKKLYDL